MRQLINSLTAITALILSSCGFNLSSPPQLSCNFIENNNQQRISWGPQVPVKIIVDSESVSSEFYPSIEAAARKWNEAIGKEILKIDGWTSDVNNSIYSGLNVLYFKKNWDETIQKEALTTVYFYDTRIFRTETKVNIEDYSLSSGDNGTEGKIDLESLLIHEFGHVLGLGHIPVYGSVMFPTLGPETSANLTSGFRREINTEDIKSINCEY